MNKIPVVVIGGGNMGKNHIRLLSENPRFSLVAIVDPAQDHVYPGNIPVLSSIEELDKQALEYQAAIIAAPTALHFDIGCKMVARGKHMLMEKPLCATLADSDKLLEMADKAGLHLAVGHVERYNPAITKLAEVVNAGWIGEPIHVSATRVGGYPKTTKASDNVLLDLAVHDIDVIRYLFGKLKVVSCIWHRIVQENIPDTAEILLRGEQGLSASIHVNWITPTKIRQLTVTGTRGVCTVDYMLQTCELSGGNLIQAASSLKTDFESLVKQYQNSDRIVFGVQKSEPLKIEHEVFADMLSGKDVEMCMASDGRNAVELAQMALNLPQNNDGSYL